MKTLAAATVVVLASVLAACSADAQPAPTSTAPVIQLGAPGEENRTLSPDEVAGLTTAPYVEADVFFVRDMLHHHSQALIMTGYVDERTDNPDVRLIAERMDVSQTDEMDLMESWLQQRGEAARDPDGGHLGHSIATMPGILTDQQLSELDAARGGEFDRLFLEYMIMHHQGAITMVTELYEAGGGQETAIDQIARHVEADQNIEIGRMRTMLASMD